MVCWSESLARFVRRISRWNKEDLVKPKSCAGLPGNVQMTKMDRIERAAEETDSPEFCWTNKPLEVRFVANLVMRDA